jgi:hypothetical protein
VVEEEEPIEVLIPVPRGRIAIDVDDNGVSDYDEWDEDDWNQNYRAESDPPFLTRTFPSHSTKMAELPSRSAAATNPANSTAF